MTNSDLEIERWKQYLTNYINGKNLEWELQKERMNSSTNSNTNNETLISQIDVTLTKGERNECNKKRN